MATLTHDEVDEALAPLRDMLAADGYEVHVTLDAAAARLVLDVQSSDAACADCLVPPATLDVLARSFLTDAGVDAHGMTIDILHPKDR